MGKKTKLAVWIGIISAVVSAVILVVVFWDKILELFPCCHKDEWEDDFLEEDDVPEFTSSELEDFADLED